jgi:hypothetical protein
MLPSKLTVVVYGTKKSAICRDVTVACVNDLLVAVASATSELCELNGGQTCAYVVVQPMSVKRTADTTDLLPVGDIEIINICGRVTHLHTTGCVVQPACEPLMMKNRDSFGLRTGLFTVFGNFMTSESNKTTLFRGARRCSEVLMISEHIFRQECVDSIVMHMLVAKSRLPHAVLVEGVQFECALSDNKQWSVSAITTSDDMTYMKALHLRVHDGRNTCILLHMYTSGVVFFFVTCPDTTLSVEEERRVAAQCGDIYEVLAAVC